MHIFKSNIYITTAAIWAVCCFGCSRSSDSEVDSTAMTKMKEGDPTEGMVWIPGGEFLQGADYPGAYKREYPAHRTRVNGFWMDKTEVTNAQFLEFVNETGYKTVAERDVDWEDIKNQVEQGTPKPADSLLQAGSLIFAPPRKRIPLDDFHQWWRWKVGANWKHPEGPGSNIEDRQNHPVVHIAYEDALAFCEWSGKRLPTEAEWEFAARGGNKEAKFPWGKQNPIQDSSELWANIWQGEFPYDNTGQDGYFGTAPVAQYAPNGYGLYDMAGNVWELCSDYFSVNYYSLKQHNASMCNDPKGPKKSHNPLNPYEVERVHKGGSFLCHYSYCENYRISSREGIAEDTGLPHSGFRCVIDKKELPL